jgi:hypothetical protein
LSVFDQMSLMRWIPSYKRELGIAHPFAAGIDPVTWDAPGTAHIRDHGTAGRAGIYKKLEREHPSHPLPFMLPGLGARHGV